MKAVQRMHDIGRHAPFSASYPPIEEVEKWLNGRKIHEACMTPDGLAAYLGERESLLLTWRSRRVERTPPWFRFVKRIWYPKESMLALIESAEAVRL